MRGHVGDITQLFPVWKEFYLVRENYKIMRGHMGEITQLFPVWKEFYTQGRKSSQFGKSFS
jgi:hypothetical protein